MPFGMFGHAASRWGTSQGENLATSALVYLLGTYPEVGDRFCRDLAGLMGDSGMDLQLRFVEQLITAGGGRMDAAGITPAGERFLAVECKFDAALGDAQIRDYLDEVTSPGILLLVVPRQRRAQVMMQAARTLDVGADAFVDRNGYFTATARASTVAVTDWLTLLTSFAASSTDIEFGTELKQLRSYVDLMTGDEFTPLTPDDVSGRRGARWRHFHQLLDEALSMAQANGFLRTAGSLGGSHGYSGRGLHFGPWVGWGGLWAAAWADTADTPLWLNFSPNEAGRPELDIAMEVLRPLNAAGQRLFERQGAAVVALYLKCGTNRGDVVTDLVDQLRAVHQLIPADAPLRRGAVTGSRGGPTLEGHEREAVFPPIGPS